MIAAVTAPVLTSPINGQALSPDNSRTPAQVLLPPNISTGELPKRGMEKDWVKKVRKMRRDPTVAIARELAMAPILAAEWTIEGVDENDPTSVTIGKFLSEQLFPIRSWFLRQALMGINDFGWQAFEKVCAPVDIDDAQGYPMTYVGLKKLKMLLTEYTTICVNPDGSYSGVINRTPNDHFLTDPNSITGVYLEPCETLLMYREVEGTNWYGEALMRRLEQPYDDWLACNKAAQRFDTKIAGAHWVVYYPLGTSMVNGTETDNVQVAQAIINSLQASGSIVVPRSVSNVVDDLNQASDEKNQWKIDIMEAGLGVTPYGERMNYLDKLKVRGAGLPERSVLEGQFGTKAEAEAHADMAIANIEMTHADQLVLVNWHLVNYLIRINWGEEYENKIKLKAAPLADAKRAFLRDVYKALLTNQQAATEEIASLDRDAIREQLGLPSMEQNPFLAGIDPMTGLPYDQGVTDVIDPLTGLPIPPPPDPDDPNNAGMYQPPVAAQA